MTITLMDLLPSLQNTHMFSVSILRKHADTEREKLSKSILKVNKNDNKELSRSKSPLDKTSYSESTEKLT